MEFENSDEPLFNSSTEFLITFDPVEDTKLGKPNQQCEDSPAVKEEIVSGNESLVAHGRPVKTADAEHIMCEFSDSDTDWFASRNTGAGESANAGDAWSSIMQSAAPAIHADAHESTASEVLTAGSGSFELRADRNSEYEKHGSSELSIAGDGATDVTDVTLLELVDTSCNTLSDVDQNQTIQLTAPDLPADQQFTNEPDSINHDNDIFLEFGAVSYADSDNTNPPQMVMIETDCKKLADADNDIQFLFPDSDEFSEHISGGEHNSVKQEDDIFSDFRAISYIAGENTNPTGTLMMEANCKKLDDAEHNQDVQFLFPDSDKFCEQLNDSEHASVLVPTDAPLVTQQIVEFSDEVLLEKHEIHASLPDVHRSVTNQELISEFSDRSFSEETRPDVIAQISESPQPAVDASDTVFIDEVQV